MTNATIYYIYIEILLKFGMNWKIEYLDFKMLGATLVELIGEVKTWLGLSSLCLFEISGIFAWNIAVNSLVRSAVVFLMSLSVILKFML
jgi:hypothetical protein